MATSYEDMSECSWRDLHAEWLDDMDQGINQVFREDFLKTCKKPNTRTLPVVEFNGVFAKRVELTLDDVLDNLLLNKGVKDALIDLLANSTCVHSEHLRSQLAGCYADTHGVQLNELLGNP